MTNFFWSVPQWVKDLCQPKGKTELNITAYKEGKSWYFDLPPITIKESLLFEDALDELAQGKDKLELTISSVPIEGADKLTWSHSDPSWPEANEYLWKDQLIWLCPWNQWYFGEVHKTLWFSVNS